MRILFTAFCFFILGCLFAFGQKANDTPPIERTSNNYFELSTGLMYTSIQNTNFSNVNWYGAGGLVGVAFKKQTDRYLLHTGGSIPLAPVRTQTHDETGNIFNPNLYLSYYRKLNSKYALGVRWDIIDYYIHSQTDLGNNQTYNLQSSSFFASLRYNAQLKKRWPIWTTLHLGLLNFNREGFSFAFSAPQNVLEEGDFDYQDQKIDDPFALKYYELDFLTSYLNLRTSLGIQISPRSSITYEWQMRHFSQVQGYPTTTGQHFLRYSFALIYL